ncbi:MAG: hypothetical protein AAFP76_06995 [Bacteroidota bacterium]
MKRFKYIVMALVVAVGSATVFTSCEDEDKARFPELSNGGFVKFVSQPDFWEGLQIEDGVSIVKYHIGAEPADAAFNAITEDPSGNVASYELFVRGDFDGAPEDPIAYMSTTTFPFDISFSTGDMASLFNVPAETFQSGDQFFFTSTITTTDGKVFNSIVTACEECPETLLDPDTGEPLDQGAWNGGTIDGVLLQGGDTGDNFILPAIYWVVKYLDPTS